MKTVKNSGVSDKDLNRGYQDTGYIPCEGESVFKPEYLEEEKREREMAKKYGFPMEEESGGFLERNNYDDRF